MLQLLIEPLFILLLISPLVFLAQKHTDWNKTFLFLFLGYFSLDYLLIALPIYNETFSFLPYDMNWEGKIMSYGGAIVFLLFSQFVKPKAIGLQLEDFEASRTFFFRHLIGLTLLVLVYGVLIGGYQYSLENLLFQLTMPSIVEEIVYRGILLYLLNQVYTKNFRIGQTHFGMGVILTSLLFGLLHGVSIDDNFIPQIHWVSILITGIIGFYLGILKERTNSLLLPILAHIIINVIPLIIGALM